MPYFVDGNIDVVKGKGNLKKRAERFIKSIPKKLAIENLKVSSYGGCQSIISVIEKAQVALKDISDVYTYSRIEFAKFKSTTIPGDLSEMEVVNKCYFFISMLGFIDKNITDKTRWMEHYRTFMDTDEYAAERYYKLKNSLVSYAAARDAVISDLDKIEILKKEGSTLPECFKECFKKVPMFDAFGELYKGVSSSRGLEFVNSFTNAYNNGFNAYGNYDETMMRFSELSVDLQEHINEGKEKVRSYTKK